MFRLLPSSALCLGLLLGTGCAKTAPAENDPLMQADFDHLSGWVGEAPSLTRDRAHSGAYSVVVRPGVARSLGYTNTLGQLCDRRPAKIRLSAWVLRTGNQPAGRLVATITDPDAGNQVTGDSIDLGQAVRTPNAWQRVERTITVPPKASASSRLLVYLAGAGAAQPTYLDDLALRLVAE